MSRTLILSGIVALVAPSLLGAQNDRYVGRTATPIDRPWSDEAPRVRVSIEGSRAVAWGQPLRVRFEVSENAFVAVVRVDDEGRMTILFPYSRTQRAAARGGQVHYVRYPGLGEASFIATDRMGGYVFAVASYSPLDFSAFENRDYNRMGGYSRFTVANRSVARRPDVFIDRFAAAVLWDRDTPYDSDVDYYYLFGRPGMLNSYAMCGTSYFGNLYGSNSLWNGYGPAFGYYIGWHTYLSHLSSWDRMQYSVLGMCGDWYDRLQCNSFSSYSYGYNRCLFRQDVVMNPPTGIPGPLDSARVPNEGVILGGLFGPTPIPVTAGPESTLPQEYAPGRFDQARPIDGDLDNVMSIPARATRKMKEEDARREASGGASPTRTGFDRSDATAGKPEKGSASATDRETATRLEPPSREPTKAKATGEPRRETSSKGGYGSTGRTSEPRSTGTDRVSRPAEPKSSGTGTSSPPSIQGTTTEKKKPPTD